MTTAQVIETSVTINNSPIQDNTHPDDHIPLTYRFNTFTTSNQMKVTVHGVATNDKIPTSMIGAALHNHLTKHLLNQPYVEQEVTSSRTKYKRYE